MRPSPTLVPLDIRASGEGFEVSLVQRLDEDLGWTSLFLTSAGAFAWAGGRAFALVGACLLVGAASLLVVQGQQWKLRCDLMNLEVAREFLGIEWDGQRWPLASIRAFEASKDGTGLAIHFREQPRWAVSLAFSPASIQALARRLEAARAANARFWRDEVQAERSRDEAALARMIDRSP